VYDCAFSNAQLMVRPPRVVANHESQDVLEQCQALQGRDGYQAERVSRKWDPFLPTYPHCGLSKDTFLQTVCDIGTAAEIKEYRIVTKYHQDGVLHLHAVISLNSTLHISRTDAFDIIIKK
jgi:hypothetical protein